MIKKKYAVRFPDMQHIDQNFSSSLFTAKAIKETTNTFFNTFDALESLIGLAGQKVRTHELSKQLGAEKAALDEVIDNQEEQKRIEFEEYAKRLQIQLKHEKEKMEMELRQMAFEASEKINRFSISLEEDMKSNQILLGIIRNEQNFLCRIQPYIERLAEDYSQRREYVMYCDLQRQSLDLIKSYLGEMI